METAPPTNLSAQVAVATAASLRSDIGTSRYVLPMNSAGQKILPGQTAQITARPQRLAFRPERVFISDFSPPMDMALAIPPARKLRWWERLFGSKRLEAQLEVANAQLAAMVSLLSEIGSRSQRGACDWLVHDITIGNRSQFAQSGALPGDMFGSSGIGMLLTWETAQTAMDVVMVVEYRGPIKEGVVFHGSIIGAAAV